MAVGEMSAERKRRREKIIAATLKLAEDTKWRSIGLNDIALVAEVPLADLRGEFRTKAEILAAFTRKIDDDVMEKAGSEAAGGRDDEDVSARERLFEVLMTRLEVLAPYRPALKNVFKGLRTSPGAAALLLGPVMSSNYWMLTTAGIAADGSRGAARVPGLMAVWARVLPVWLDDDDPGLAKTMAALDRHLTRGEGWIGYAENICEQGNRFLCALIPPFVRSREKGAGRPNGGNSGMAEPNGGAAPVEPVNGN